MMQSVLLFQSPRIRRSPRSSAGRVDVGDDDEFVVDSGEEGCDDALS